MLKTLENTLEKLRKKDPHLEALLMAEIERRDSQLQDKDIQLQEVIAAYEAEIEKRVALQRLIFGRKSERFVEVSE